MAHSLSAWIGRVWHTRQLHSAVMHYGLSVLVAQALQLWHCPYLLRYHGGQATPLGEERRPPGRSQGGRSEEKLKGS